MSEIPSQANNADFRWRLYNRRNISYKIGCFFIALSFALYISSLLSSTWFKPRSYEGESWGLWHLCESRIHGCHRGNELFSPLQHISSFCGVAYLAVIVFAVIENCRPVQRNYHSRKLEWSALITAFIGTGMNLYFLVYYIRLWKVSLGWAYIVNCAALVLLYAASVLIACGNNDRTYRQRSALSEPQRQQTLIYSSHEHQMMDNTQTHNFASDHHQMTDNSCPPPSYASCTNETDFDPNVPDSPPPPYVLPPAYPGGNQFTPSSSSSAQHAHGQRQPEAISPLLPHTSLNY